MSFIINFSLAGHCITKPEEIFKLEQEAPWVLEKEFGTLMVQNALISGNFGIFHLDKSSPKYLMTHPSREENF